MRFFFSLLIGFFIVALAPVRVAWAQQPKVTKQDKAEAARLKKEADQLMDQGRHIDALTLYQKAYEHTQDPALVYNQGRALEMMGEYPEALEKLERFDREASPALRSKVPGLHDLITDLRGRIATLVVTTNAPGARLLVREKAVGTIEKETKLRTRAGLATVEVNAEGYVPFKQEVDLKAGSTVKVDAQLALKKSDAIIIVRSRPTADILMDGKAIGRSPLELKVQPGKHELVAEAEGHENEKVPMTLALGDRREIDIELRRQAPVTSRWWFWTAIGAAVAGGVVAALALTIERDPTPGTFDKGVATGP